VREAQVAMTVFIVALPLVGRVAKLDA